MSHLGCDRWSRKLRATKLLKVVLLLAPALLVCPRSAFLGVPPRSVGTTQTQDSTLRTVEPHHVAGLLVSLLPLPAVAEPIVYEPLEINWVNLLFAIPVAIWVVPALVGIGWGINATIPALDTDEELARARLNAPMGMSRFALEAKEKEEKKVLKAAKKKKKLKAAKAEPWGQPQQGF
mmetsp:Transcript_19559/g.45474  ORF Transcript_19559/g.45474 Transcript_19559/m.45474 type:complete len:178 (-) Transcript_19559:52-585(-)|eukprot:CAMPEP_0178410008 /NCGR_PEP_ID=MMETSP0689_2-20121128/20756_1 /TAXON_ID=160604 /ORGANISM="Amphidinium massartii, Strain CS-259" /LENGTH=177 /DNA_ID=CAMNT_0020031167 /DNA_START=61 /DNA_END=594 /DNA_ORIENTATION=+